MRRAFSTVQVENLPADEDVKKVERRLKSDEKTLTKKNSKKK